MCHVPCARLVVQSPQMKSSYITASEIGEYVYCPRGWWLRIKGRLPLTPQMTKGVITHDTLLQRIDWTPRLKIIALLLVSIGLMIFILIFKSLTQL